MNDRFSQKTSNFLLKLALVDSISRKLFDALFGVTTVIKTSEFHSWFFRLIASTIKWESGLGSRKVSLNFRLSNFSNSALNFFKLLVRMSVVCDNLFCNMVKKPRTFPPRRSKIYTPHKVSNFEKNSLIFVRFSKYENGTRKTAGCRLYVAEVLFLGPGGTCSRRYKHKNGQVCRFLPRRRR